MVTYSEIQDKIDDGKTPAQIAAELQAVTRHKRDAYVTTQDSTPANPDLLFLLSSRYRVLRLNKSAEWVGGLVDAIDASQSETLQAAFGELLNNLQITGRKVFAYSDETGSTGLLIETIAGIVGQITAAAGTYTQQQVIDGVNALTGGRLYAGVTEADVQAVIDGKGRDDAYAAIVAKANAATSQAALALEQELTPDEITAAGVAGWEGS